MNESRSGSRRRTVSRRAFLQRAAAAVAAPTIMPASVFGSNAPSNRINVGIIGLGDRGGFMVRSVLRMEQAQVVAVCDVYRSKAERFRGIVDEFYAGTRGLGYQACTACQDARELIARPDIDAVFVTSPENWHAMHGALAVKAGKDVYGEKGLTLTVNEGRQLVESVRRHAAVFQVGTQQRSDGRFRKACELAHNGYLGEIKEIRVGVPSGASHFPKLNIAAPCAPPADIDYEMWLGPAPWTPYNDRKCTYYWYFMTDYCAGWIQSWGIHHVDIALWGQPVFTRGRITVEGEAEFPTDGLADVSYRWKTKITASNGLQISFCDNGQPGHGQGVQFIGSAGRVHVTRGGIRAEPESLLSARLKPDDERLQMSTHHLADFFESIRTRRDPVAPVEAGHRANTVTLLCDIATRLRRPLTFDWDSQMVIDDAVANTMLGRSCRAPWRL
jgi:predicted dehydrogenase